MVALNVDLAPDSASAVRVGVERKVLGEVGHPQVDTVAGRRLALGEVFIVQLVFRRTDALIRCRGVGERAQTGVPVVLYSIARLAVEAAEAAQVVRGQFGFPEVERVEARSQVCLNATARFGEAAPVEGGSRGVKEAWGRYRKSVGEVGRCW